MKDKIEQAVFLATILSLDERAMVTFGKDDSWLGEGKVKACAADLSGDGESYDAALDDLLVRLRVAADTTRRAIRQALSSAGPIDEEERSLFLWSAICGSTRITVTVERMEIVGGRAHFEVSTGSILGRKGVWASGPTKQEAFTSLVRRLRDLGQNTVDLLTEALAKSDPARGPTP